MGHFVAACRRRVVYRFAQGAGKRFLRWTGPLGRRVLKFDGPLGRGLWWRLRRRLCRRVVFASAQGATDLTG